jgi:thymidylate kinase
MEVVEAEARKLVGKFIVFEGCDGVGKRTQARMLAQHIENGTGTEVLLLSSPTRSGDARFEDPRAEALLSAAKRWETESLVVSALARGATVVADRYAASGAAYARARGLDWETVSLLLAGDTLLSRPDVIILLDGPSRGPASDASIELRFAVRKAFMETVNEGWSKEGWRVVSGEGNAETVEDRVWAAAVGGLRVGSGPTSAGSAGAVKEATRQEEEARAEEEAMK